MTPITPGLIARHLRVGYGSREILGDLSVAPPTGAFTAIIGPNGCGKSTLLKSLGRAMTPRAGTVTLDGTDLARMRPKAIARRLALLPQDPIAPDTIRVRDLVARGRHPYHSVLRQWAPGDTEAVDRALEQTGVAHLADRFVSELSGGQRQRAWVALVLAQDTEYVLLDEPTSFLDIAHQIDLLHRCQDMRAAGKTVIAVLHDLNQAARYADHLIVMHEGAIVAEGAPAEVLSAELVREVFALPAEITTDPQSGSPLIVPLARG
ncbi:iron complex transport system ATP-binding protein [Mycetocola sp. BIGb0189]|uniref:ABC transporter ATP-binding protein n=1 Tax=Mycetocola sp. BIGb0189 TaxID=2940604 RepID=UPI002166DE5C|nr:ABC transporter ATP-binding protein [Mycetocola sp. BIGb0189]MCS4277024.1 iron complex transport system ATP-binding protein [Mycetocola sp. BIGb0189]